MANPNPTYRVDYVDHAGNDARVYVRVRPTLSEDGALREVFYATHDRLGCGKNADTPEAAARRLVADHGRAIFRIALANEGEAE